MNDYDQAARFAAKRLDPLGFLLWVMDAPFGLAWLWRGWLDTQAVPFPGEPDYRCDTVAAFERRAHDGPPLALVVARRPGAGVRRALWRREDWTAESLEAHSRTDRLAALPSHEIRPHGSHPRRRGQ